MKVFRSNNLAAIAALCIIAVPAAFLAGGVDASKFTPIRDGINPDVTGISINLGRRRGRESSAPDATVTVVPTSSSVVVESYPANLVTVSSDEDTLTVDWNRAVAPSWATRRVDAEVRIGVPAGQLRNVEVDKGSKVEIADGFTKVFSLHVSGKSTVAATFTELKIDELVFDVEDASTATVKANAALEGQVEHASTANLEAPVVSVDVSDASTVIVVGDCSDGSIFGGSTLTISDGVITDGVDAHEASIVNVGEADVCARVSLEGESKCNVHSLETSLLLSFLEDPKKISLLFGVLLVLFVGGRSVLKKGANAKMD